MMMLRGNSHALEMYQPRMCGADELSPYPPMKIANQRLPSLEHTPIEASESVCYQSQSNQLLYSIIIHITMYE